MFIDLKRRSGLRAFTLTEMMISMAISLIVIGSVLSGFMFCSKNMLWLSNSATLNQSSQTALNRLTRELRGMARVLSYTRSPNSAITAISFLPKNSTSTNDVLQLEYIANGKRLLRRRGDLSEVILADCNSLQFNLFQRTQTNGTFSSVPTTNAELAKLVQVQWVCSRYGGPSREQMQVSQSAQIVMRAK